MSLSSEAIADLEALAALSLSPDERERLRGHLEKILGHMKQLDEVDTTGVESTSSVVGADAPMRDDEPRPCLPRERVLEQAPASHEGHFEVPVVMGDNA